MKALQSRFFVPCKREREREREKEREKEREREQKKSCGKEMLIRISQKMHEKSPNS